MKKSLFLLAFAICQIGAWATEMAQPSGSGTSADPYLIGTVAEFEWFANEVNVNGNTSICAKLTRDVNLGDDQTMIGTSTNCYSGTFDGNNHCITVAYVATETNTALFRYVKDATIKGLHTDGSVKTETYLQALAGIVAHCDGTTNITKCWSTATIECNYSEQKDGTCGGIVANNQGVINVNNVLFAGKLLGKNATYCGGIVGWSKSTANVSNCLFMPEEVTIDVFTAGMFSRGSDVNVSNCYFTYQLGLITVGTEISADALKSGEAGFKLNSGVMDGSQAWYQKIGTDDYPLFDTNRGTIYGALQVCPSTEAYSNSTHTCTFDENGIGTCENCSAELVQPSDYDSASKAYIIKNPGNFVWFAYTVDNVKKNINGKLTCDINLNDVNGKVRDYWMNTFCGKLTGENAAGNDFALLNSTHPLTLYLSRANLSHLVLSSFKASGKEGLVATESENSNISYIVMKNSTLSSSYGQAGLILGISTYDNIQYCSTDKDCYLYSVDDDAAGLVGQTLSSTIKYCHNAAKVWSEKGYCGGITGYFVGLSISNCLNTGNIYAKEMTGGIVGYANGSSISMCVNTGIVDSSEKERHEGKGGILGISERNAVVSNCFNFGSVNWATTGKSGAIVGEGAANASNNYYYCQFNGKHTESLPEGVSYADMVSGKYAMDIDYLYQSIDNGALEETMPVPLPAAGTVYSNVLCDGTQSYSNYYKSTASHTAVDEDNTGTCDVCGVWTTLPSTVYISNAVQLNELARFVNSGKNYDSALIYFSKDIDLKGFTYTPIGTTEHPFTGMVYGQEHRIKNMSTSGTGLFGVVGQCQIFNIIIDGSCSINSTANGVAGLVGSVQSTSGKTCNVGIWNCGNEANIYTTGNNAGGILGAVNDNDNTAVTIYNCYNAGNISGNGKSAAICGYARMHTTFDNCWNSGTISGVTDKMTFWYTDKEGNDCKATNCYDVNTTLSEGVTGVTAKEILYGDLYKELAANQDRAFYRDWCQDISTDTHPTYGDGGLYYSRDIDSQWGTVILPYTVESNDSITYYTISDIKDNDNSEKATLILKRVSYVTPNTPCIFYCEKGDSTQVIIRCGDNIIVDPTLDSYTTACTSSEVQITGVYSKAEVKDYYTFINNSSAFWNVYTLDTSAKKYVNPFYAYLTIPGASDKKELDILIDYNEDGKISLEDIDYLKGKILNNKKNYSIVNISSLVNALCNPDSSSATAPSVVDGVIYGK